MDEVRRRVQQDTLGHRGHAGDPLYRVRNILHRAAGDLTDRQWAWLTDCLGRGDPDDEVLIAWQCYQRVRAAYVANTPADGKAIAEHIVATFLSSPIPEIARLGRTLRQWKDTYLGYFATGGANNGGAEAINGIIELHRRIARGYRNPHNYRLRMLLVARGILLPPDLRRATNRGRGELTQGRNHGRACSVPATMPSTSQREGAIHARLRNAPTSQPEVRHRGVGGTHRGACRVTD